MRALIDIFFASANIRPGLNNAALRAVFYFRWEAHAKT
ncbi:hypothetical protein CEV32_2366 [Brucella rhizosphaerae]|uniref:Uncharacterized protein n=1 Tax=Brucella rhizosphaerae TaxID=571254 RepID=A0A256F512_9HYPH|nr:hypothetical protein CEV32_2366 [Brucella rhizosphaerae]